MSQILTTHISQYKNIQRHTTYRLLAQGVSWNVPDATDSYLIINEMIDGTSRKQLPT